MKLRNGVNETKGNGWSLPGWSWKAELSEVLKCLIASMVAMAVMAVPAKYVFDTYFEGASINAAVCDPSQSSAYYGNAGVAGGTNQSDDSMGGQEALNPSMDPVNTSRLTKESPADGREDGSGPKDPSNVVIDIDGGYVDNGVAPELRPIKPDYSTDVELVSGRVSNAGYPSPSNAIQHTGSDTPAVSVTGTIS